MKKNLLSFILLLISSLSFGQSANILPNTTTLVADGTNQVLKVTNTNTSNGSKIMEVITNGGSNAFSLTHSGSSGDAINVYKSGDAGRAGYFNIASNLNVDEAIGAYTVGIGNAGNFRINNNLSIAAAIYGTSNGTGYGIQGINNGTGNGSAGHFSIQNASNTGYAIQAYTIGTGGVGNFSILNSLNSSHALFGNTNGTGSGVFGSNTGTGEAGHFQIYNVSNSNNVLYAITKGTGNAGNFVINNANNPSATLAASSNGTGNAGIFTISNISNSATALAVSTNGSGAGIDVNAASGIAGKFTSASGYALITGTGNVGIGTTTPAEKLEVTGKIRVSNLNGISNRPVYADANGTSTNGVTQYYGLAGTDLNLMNNPATNNAFLVTLNSTSLGLSASAPASEYLGTFLHLPDGASVISIALDCYDNSSTKDLKCTLLSVPRGGTSATTLANVQSALNPALTYSTFAGTFVGGPFPVIDNQNNYYFIRISAIDKTSGLATTWDSNLTIRGVNIGYTFQGF